MSLDLTHRQNEDSILQRLAAQRQLYGDAKRLFAAESWLAGILPVGAGFLGIFCPNIRLWAAIGSFALWWVIFAFLEPHRKRLCVAAASVQEQIDTDLLRLPAGDAIDKAHVNREEVIAAGRKHLQQHGVEKLKAWYPECTDALPPALACIVCQRSNLWWDRDLRSSYSRFCMCLLVGLAVLWIVLGLALNLTVRDAVAVWLLPLAPLIYLLAKQARSNRSLALKKAKLIAEAESLWCSALMRPTEEATLTLRSRKLQDGIYQLRAECDLVWNCLYRRTRQLKEDLMTAAAEDLVREARAALDSGTNSGVPTP